MALAPIVRALIDAAIGPRLALPSSLVERFPELAGMRCRRGGPFVRVGGWCLGARTVSGITLWRTVWLAPHVPLSPRLLLHESRHVDQFGADPILFPLRYTWESLRRGYRANRYERDAEQFAECRLRGLQPPDLPNPR